MEKGRIIKIVICVTAFCFIDGLFQCPVLRAMPRFMDWYDASPYANPDMKGQCTVCHVSNDGLGPLNEVGTAFAEADYRFTSELRAAFPGAFAGASQAVASKEPSFDAKAFFGQYCAACHGPDGKGGIGNAPDLTDAEWQRARTNTDLTKTIKEGKGLMPPWKEQLSDEQVRAMVEYVRRLAEGSR